MKKIFGKFIHGLASVLNSIFNFLINILNAIVTVFEGLSQVIMLIGCSVIFVLPLFFIAIPPELFTIFLIIAVVPFLGKSFISLLRYGNYTLIEWMYDKADTLISGEKKGFDNLSDYAKKYKLDQERERRRQAEEERQRRQEEMNQRFEEFFQGFNFSGFDFDERNYNGGYNTGSYQNSSFVNDLGFKEKYQKACDTLGVPYTSDQYEIKLAYRKLAKKYHPDISQDPKATEKFQKINDAYDFLSSDNINKYKNM